VIVDPGKSIERIVGPRLLSMMTVVAVPPLASRRGEVSTIVKETVAYHLARAGAPGQVLRPEDYARLESRSWPGNHDEMDDIVHRLVLVRHLKPAGAAKALGVTPAAISLWARKNKFRETEA
jgi:DNA-binding NtrC family response regulator